MRWNWGAWGGALIQILPHTKLCVGQNALPPQEGELSAPKGLLQAEAPAHTATHNSIVRTFVALELVLLLVHCT